MVILFLLSQSIFSNWAQLEASTVKAMKASMVRATDLTLPAISLESWMQQQVGPAVEIAWELNDCGEQTGSPMPGRDMPFCVEASARLRDGRKLVVWFFAGTEKTGLSSGPLQIYYGDVSPANGRGETLRTLQDITRLLRPQ